MWLQIELVFDIDLRNGLAGRLRLLQALKDETVSLDMNEWEEIPKHLCHSEIQLFLNWTNGKISIFKYKKQNHPILYESLYDYWINIEKE